MKQDFKNVRARYEKPALKEFQISLEGGCCQALSDTEGLGSSGSESTNWD